MSVPSISLFSSLPFLVPPTIHMQRILQGDDVSTRPSPQKFRLDSLVKLQQLVGLRRYLIRKLARGSDDENADGPGGGGATEQVLDRWNEKRESFAGACGGKGREKG